MVRGGKRPPESMAYCGQSLDMVSCKMSCPSSCAMVKRMKLSACGYHRVLKVARTIAELAGADGVSKSHIAEALSYRRITHLA
jgi:predicted ATPase with chaperone activity